MSEAKPYGRREAPMDLTPRGREGFERACFADFKPFDFGSPTDAAEDHDEVV